MPQNAEDRHSQTAFPADSAETRTDAERSARCFIVDDSRAIRQVLRLALAGSSVHCEEFGEVPSMLAALGDNMPDLVFLDISLGGSDGVEGIRGLAERGYRGTVQLVSGLDLKIIEEVRRIGERHGLHMLPVMRKPFRAEAVNRVVQDLLADIAAPKQSVEANTVSAEWNYPQFSLEELLRTDRLELWYQPKFNLKKMRLAGVEGLVRGKDPERGLIMPGAFLPNADAQSMHKLSEYVLLKALADWNDFAVAGFPLRIAVNMPVESLLKLDIPMLVRENQPKSPDWPGLILEVTEDQVVRDITLAREIAIQLQIYGIALSIDDFGAGYSHLARLRELPFAELKLDRNLVANCGEDKTNAELCRAVIDIAHRFGSLAVAEGIEKASELQTMHRLGCDLGQGYLLAQPGPKDRLIGLMRNRST